jgi:hypothetical protein
LSARSRRSSVASLQADAAARASSRCSTEVAAFSRAPIHAHANARSACRGLAAGRHRHCQRPGSSRASPGRCPRRHRGRPSRRQDVQTHWRSRTDGGDGCGAPSQTM